MCILFPDDFTFSVRAFQAVHARIVCCRAATDYSNFEIVGVVVFAFGIPINRMVGIHFVPVAALGHTDHLFNANPVGKSSFVDFDYGLWCGVLLRFDEIADTEVREINTLLKSFRIENNLANGC